MKYLHHTFMIAMMQLFAASTLLAQNPQAAVSENKAPLEKKVHVDKAIPPLSTSIPEGLEIQGTFTKIENFKSENLNNFHNIDIYLPPQYDEDETTRYPVLYTIGWNTLFITGSADPLPEGHSVHPENESMMSLFESGAIRPFILVSVSPDLDPEVSLMDECTPTQIKRRPRGNPEGEEVVVGGKVDLFAKFMIEEVKPYIDAHYRTLTDPADTGITGISKWGMGTFYIAITYPEVFGMVGGMSPALSWDNMVMAHVLDQAQEDLPLRVWMGSGENEGHYLDDMSLFHRLFISKGIAPEDVEVLVVEDGTHSGATWGPSVGPMLRFMFTPDDEEE